MKFLFLSLILFGACFINADVISSAPQEISSLKWYNQGVQHYNSQEKFKAVADFRIALQLDPLLWPAKKALDQLQHSPSFWMLIPSEIFFSLIAVSLVLLFFSISTGRLVFFFLCLALHFSFSFYRYIPRLTILETTQAHTAPNPSSSVLFSLSPGDWVAQLKTSKEWIQIKTSEQTIGWISKIKLHQK